MDQKGIRQNLRSVKGEGILKAIDKHIIEELLGEQIDNDSTDKTGKNLMKAVKLLLFRIKLLEKNGTFLNKKIRNLETGGKSNAIKPKLEYIG